MELVYQNLPRFHGNPRCWTSFRKKKDKDGSDFGGSSSRDDGIVQVFEGGWNLMITGMMLDIFMDVVSQEK